MIIQLDVSFYHNNVYDFYDFEMSLMKIMIMMKLTSEEF
jgi:hypothetical protein